MAVFWFDIAMQEHDDKRRKAKRLCLSIVRQQLQNSEVSAAGYCGAVNLQVEMNTLLMYAVSRVLTYCMHVVASTGKSHAPLMFAVDILHSYYIHK